MRREARWIQDAPGAASRIDDHAGSMDSAAWLDDHRTRDAVQYCFIVIADPDRIRRFRNVLAHEYDRVHGVIWEAVRHDLPPLQSALLALLAQADGPDDPN